MRQTSVVGQALRLRNQKAAGDAPALQFRCALQLSFVLPGIEMAFRFRDQAGIVNLPQFVAADPNVISCSCVGAGQRPVECG